MNSKSTIAIAVVAGFIYESSGFLYAPARTIDSLAQELLFKRRN
jgi:hypothetical protein